MTLFFKAVWGFLRGIPWQLWLALAVAAAAYGAWSYHTSAVKTARTEGHTAGVVAESDRWAKAQAEADKLALKGVIATIEKQNDIAQETSDALEQATDDIDARARALSVRHDAALRRIAAEREHLSATGGAAGEPQEAPPADGLPWDVALPLMTQAAKDLAQLNAILDFEEAQAALAAEGAPHGKITE